MATASFRTEACIHFREENDMFHACDREVSRKILEVMALPGLPGASVRARASVHFKDSTMNSFDPCDPGASQKLLENMANGVCNGIVTIWNRYFQYNLKLMTLRSIDTNEEADILIEFPWVPNSLISIVGNEDKNLKRQLLMMALDRIRKRASLRKILTMKNVPATCEIRENPHLESGHPSYDNFIESLYHFLEENLTRSQGINLQPTLFEKFLDCASEDATPDTFATIERENIRMVFHGTNPTVMETILHFGLIPDCRLYFEEDSEKDRDYFALKCEDGLRHTIRKMKVPRPDNSYPATVMKVKALLFMVINSVPSGEESVSVHSNECELVLAEITPTVCITPELSGNMYV